VTHPNATRREPNLDYLHNDHHHATGPLGPALTPTARSTGTAPADASIPEPVAARQRATRQGAAIDGVLTEADGFITAHELHDELRRRKTSVGMTTVYRQLKALVDSGLLDVVTRPDGEASYRLCGPTSTTGSSEHHHHLVCKVCGYTVEVEGPEVETWADQVAQEAGFTDVTHTLEIFGLCDRHGSAAANPQPPTSLRTSRTGQASASH
jgi:Fur family ferric uptake transcriptional regulator